METLDTETVGYPEAKLVNIQFGLLTTEHAVQLSVYKKWGGSLVKPNELRDSRFGLPNADQECKTCGEKLSDNCEGHFGHVVFPEAIYHPNYVPEIVKLLNKICMACLHLKAKKKVRNSMLEEDSFEITPAFDDKSRIERAVSANGVANKFALTPSLACSLVLPSPKKEAEESKPMLCATAGQICNQPEVDATTSQKNQKLGDSRTFKSTPVEMVIDLTDDADESESLENADGCSKRQTFAFNDKSSQIKSTYSKEQINSTSRKKQMEDLLDPGKKACKYCKEGSYPKMEFKIERKIVNKNIVEKIYVLVDQKVPPPAHYLKFIRKDFEDSSKEDVRPSEVLRLLSKLSDKTVKKSGMDIAVARPEALLLECLLIPPNCNRIPERPVHDSSLIESDMVTRHLRKIVQKLDLVRKYAGKNKVARRICMEEMQILLADYMRIKGAPKVVGNKEPTMDYVRRIKKDPGKSCSTKLKDQIVAKVSSFSSRAVLTGDSFLSLDEIGIPVEIAKGITVTETVTNFNVMKMQEIIDNGPKSYHKTGAMHVVRAGTKRDLFHGDLYTVELGDSVGRHLQDGDYVFCNRPPSVHKHSIIGLRVKLVDTRAFVINPITCSPLGADFDGDCLDVFVPQSLESRAELLELLTVQRQMRLSRNGQCTFFLTQDALLSAHQLTSSHRFIRKEAMQQSCLYMQCTLPEAAIIKSPKGRFWTSNQLYQLCLPNGLNFQTDAVCISDGELLFTNGESEWLGNSSYGLLQSIMEQYGDEMAFHYLDSSQKLLVDWLSLTGFSVGLLDVYAVKKMGDRRMMNQEIRQYINGLTSGLHKRDCSLRSLFSQPPSEAPLDGCSEGKPILCSFLRKFSLQTLEDFLPHVEKIVLNYVPKNNSILSMVKAGSKGSIKKLVEQFGFLGLQIHNAGSTSLSKKSEAVFPSLEYNLGADMSKNTEINWQEWGLVETSYVEGLSPSDFFIHTVAYRETATHETLKVSEPGCLFKNLMLFMRDVYIDFDNTVRIQHGKHVIQFNYFGAEGTGDQLKDDAQHNSGFKKCDILPAGEPVGTLAATAVTQPAYEMLLESSKQQKSRSICPLELLQETLYTRTKSVWKDCDRRVILYLTQVQPKEKSAIRIQRALKNVTLEVLSLSTSIKHAGTGVHDDDWQGPLPPKSFPWIGHIVLNRLSLNICKITTKEILKSLRDQHKDLMIFLREQCVSESKEPSNRSQPCISFCQSSSEGHSSTEAAKSYSNSESLSKIMHDIIPKLLKTSILGYNNLQSVEIMSSDLAHESWLSEQPEPVIEIMVKRDQVKRKSDAWHLVKNLTLPFQDLIDWSRTMPGSIQGLFETHGIEASRACIFQRLKNVFRIFGSSVHTQHLMLLGDMITHTGLVVGFNAAGYRAFTTSLNTSAPLTLSLFQNTIKNIQRAALKGKCDFLNGAVSSICFGKYSGAAKFELLWREFEG